MKQFLLLILFVTVFTGTSYIGWEWVQKQAYVVFSRQYVQEVTELQQTWNSQLNYLHGRDLLNEFYYQRRWSHLNNWARLLIEYNKKLNLSGDFIQTVDKFLKAPFDFRDVEKTKFYVLELKDRLSRLQGSQLKKNSRLFILVVSKFVLIKSLVDENKNLARQVFHKLPQMELAFQAELDIDENSLCSTQNQLSEREKILADFKQFCLIPKNSKLTPCQSGADFFKTDTANLKKVDQFTLGKIKSHSAKVRDPACAQ